MQSTMQSLDLSATDAVKQVAGSVKKRRKVHRGGPSNKLVKSAYVGGNQDIFPDIMRLYVKPGSIVADVTYGKGVFWRNIPSDQYQLLPTDIRTGTDCRLLPCERESMDCVVLDPPYMHSPGGSTHAGQTAFEEHYRNNGSGNQTGVKYHDAVVSLYVEAGAEAHRVLRNRGGRSLLKPAKIYPC